MNKTPEHYKKGSYIHCKRCGGKGSVTDNGAKALTAFTFGLLFPFLFVLKVECPMCEGKGLVTAGE